MNYNLPLLIAMKLLPTTTYILDGAFGTELQRRGYSTKLPLWSAQALFDHPDTVRDIHTEYILAGADIITTNTFRTQRRTLAKAGLEKETERINQLAVQLCVEAREAAQVGRPVYIAGSLTTLEDCYEVDLVPENSLLEIEHTDQANILAATPIDFFLLETFNTIREAKAAAEAVSKTGKGFIMSFVTNADGNLLSGETLAEAVKVIDAFSPIAYMINCVSIATATTSLEKLKAATTLPFGAYANGDGEAHNDEGWLFTEGDNRVDQYMRACQTWKDLGATLIGGCCGTNPEYTKAYATLGK